MYYEQGEALIKINKQLVKSRFGQNHHIIDSPSQIRQKEEELYEREKKLKEKEEELYQREKDFNETKNNFKNKQENSRNKTNGSFFTSISQKHILPAYKILSNGMEMPYIGLGTSRINNEKEIVYNAIKNGLRLIDTAFKYGNEVKVGQGIKQALEDGLCKREDLFIIGKIWMEFRDDPEKAIKDTMKNLGDLDYLDLYLDHWPSGNNYEFINNIKKQVSIFDMWPKMEALVDKGLTKGIGLSNYNVQSILNILSFCRIRPVVNEVEFHPYYYQENLKKFCEKENIALIAYYPLARGNGARKFILENEGKMDAFKENNILKLSDKYKKTPAQIIINWEISQGIISIPGTSNIEHFIENFEALDFKMDDEDYKSLCSEGKKMKFCDCRRFFGMNIMS